MRKILFLLIATGFLIIGCKPDLTVSNVRVQWNGSQKSVDADIQNIGNKDAGAFLVYFNGDENPVSDNHRPQVSQKLPGLAKGATVTLHADFAPLAHPDNAYLANVYQITVIADPKNMIDEKDENNNTASYLLSQQVGCVWFGPPPPVNTQYGQAAGNSPGDEIMFTADSIRVTVENFHWMSGGAFNKAYIDQATPSFGAGQTMRTNNINLKFDLTRMAFPVGKVTFDFLDMGGFENFSVNGQPAPMYVGELTAAPSAGGCTVVVTAGAVAGGKTGTVTITGQVKTVTVGGQELWLDNFCAER